MNQSITISPEGKVQLHGEFNLEHLEAFATRLKVTRDALVALRLETERAKDALALTTVVPEAPVSILGANRHWSSSQATRLLRYLIERQGRVVPVRRIVRAMRPKNEAAMRATLWSLVQSGEVEHPGYGLYTIPKKDLA